MSPAVGGECCSVARFREKGVECRYDLSALSDGRNNALDRTRAHITNRASPLRTAHQFRGPTREDRLYKDL
jgi:hypothetical protein